MPKIITQETCEKRFEQTPKIYAAIQLKSENNTFWKVVNEVKQKCICIKQKCWKQMKKMENKKIAIKSIELSENGKMYEKKET